MNKALNYRIELLKTEHLENDYYCFDFKKPKNFAFVEGQFGVFELKTKEIEGRNFRAFSIASTNDESILRFATRIVKKPSEFKHELLELTPGDEILMTAPKGKFVLEESFPAVFIAGGIGITPIRSMLLSKERNKEERNDILIYSELEECYPFKGELEKLKGLTIKYAADVEPTQKVIIETAEKYKNKVFYYVSGSPGFVNGICGLLEEHGVKKEHQRHDIFTGY